MSDHLALPVILDELDRRLHDPATDPMDIMQVLRAMQRAGLSQTDIEVHLERARVVNDVVESKPEIEANCLLGLDIVTGHAGEISLSWDSPALASVYVPLAISDDLVQASVPAAFTPSDMLPVRPGESSESEELLWVGAQGALMHQLRSGTWEPLRCDEYRVPKGPFTTRPAALLAMADRIVFESLATVVEPRLVDLPQQALWPRSRSEKPDPGVYRSAPTTWDSQYVVKADIASFYEAVEHSTLAMIAASKFGCTSDYVQAIEHFLGGVMGRSTGLPQGPLASDVFASIYLSLLDERLAELGWPFVRFADDYLIGADSMAVARERIESVERMLSSLNLHLNDSKTLVMRRETYVRGLEQPARQLVKMRKDLVSEQATYASVSDDSDDVAEVLTDLGADEQLLFDVLYHGSTSIEDAIAELAAAIDPEASLVRLAYLVRLANRLASQGAGDNLAASFGTVRDSIAYMAAAQEPEALGASEALLTWFPGLAPVVSLYLESIWEPQPSQVTEVLLRLLSPSETPDWTASWLCRAIQRHSGQLPAELVTRLSWFVETGSAGPLTRMVSVWALAAHGALTPSLWTVAMKDASDAERAELALAKLGAPAGYESVPELPG